MPFCVSGASALNWCEQLEPGSRAYAPGSPLGQGSERQRVNALGYQRYPTSMAAISAGEAPSNSVRAAAAAGSMPVFRCLPPLRNDLQRVVEPRPRRCDGTSFAEHCSGVTCRGHERVGTSCFALMPSMEACQRGRDRLRRLSRLRGCRPCGLSTAGVTVERGRDWCVDRLNPLPRRRSLNRAKAP